MATHLHPLVGGSIFTIFPAHIQQRIIFLMDFPALMKFRALCRETFTIVDTILRAEFHAILVDKVPRPFALHHALVAFEVYMGSFSALAFFLRAPFHLDYALELFVPRSAFDAMRQHLQDVQRAICVSDKPVAAVTRGVIRVSEWRSQTGALTLYRSMTEDAMHPILRGSSTAMMVYANPIYFGVIWPSLTFKLRMMPGPLRDAPDTYMPMFRAIGFTARLYVWMWKDMGSFQTCGADHFLCPAQPRYIHDAGAFRGRWTPQAVQPLVIPACFRLDTRPCRGVCREQHTHLSNNSLLAFYL